MKSSGWDTNREEQPDVQQLFIGYDSHGERVAFLFLVLGALKYLGRARCFSSMEMNLLSEQNSKMKPTS